MLSNNYSPYSPTLTTNSQVTQPRAIVMINGFSVLWEDITITTTTFYVADSYRIKIPLKGQPLGFDMAYLSVQDNLEIRIYIGYPLDPKTFSTNNLELLMVGDCDEMVIDPLTSDVTFTGRDLTSRLIDTKTYSYYANQTASSIAIQLANEHGLKTDRITSTEQSVGQFYTRQNTLMTKETTQWDLLTFLAQQYNFVVYVEQDYLVFGPKPTIDNTQPYILHYQAPNILSSSPIFNGMSLSMTRSFTVAKDVTVKVRVPYSPQTGRAFTETVGKRNPTINSRTAANQVYTFTYPGLTKSQALAKAQSLLEEITLNEIRISCALPGDSILKKSSLISLQGTNSRFDQYYYTDTVVRNINIYDGYTMEVNAKNHDVNNQVTL